MKSFKRLHSRTIILPQADIDTDQIVPARFLTTTNRQGLGAAAFYDWRHDSDGHPHHNHVLNNINSATHQILVAGPNFGCGSSREHAPWALLDLGFRVVISSDIADIFTSNALKNGLLPIEVPDDVHARLLDTPGMPIVVDLENQHLMLDTIICAFSVEPFARRCMLDGVDPLGHLLAQSDKISAYEAKAG